ncbi:MAG: hypothetical protein PHR75_02665 [Sulfurovum sp.]|nr:hypothetical protein [Sulfurovum sp.]MDD3601992.1 hypothetical protein [Sulfurovum sp.]
MDTLYLILFLLILLIGSVTTYTYYLKEKKSELAAIKRGFCPTCHVRSIELSDQRSGGCCGPKIVTFVCKECGYTNTFSMHDSDCAI